MGKVRTDGTSQVEMCDSYLFGVFNLEAYPSCKSYSAWVLNLQSCSSYPFLSIESLSLHVECFFIWPYLLLCFCSISLLPFGGHLGYFHKDNTDPSKTPSPVLPNQFADSKTNIVFNQMQLGLQVKILSQLKLIRPIMSLEESWVSTTCIGSLLVTNNNACQ